MIKYWIIVTTVVVDCIILVSGCPQQCRSCENNVVDCSDKRLRNPPKVYPAGSQVVNLNKNIFTVLGPRSFQRLASLEILKISGNKIRVVRAYAFRPFTNLLTLDLSNNQLVKIYGRGLQGARNLRTLSLSNNKMRSVARIFTNTPRLFQLNLAVNRITKLGEGSFAMNTDLHYLDLRHNRISSIHRNTFNNLVSLRTLFLNNNPIVNLPLMNFGSHVLQLLDFSHCQLNTIPQGLPSSIEDLRLSHNKLTRINQSDLANVTGLKMITLNENEIDILEYFAFGNSIELQEVWIRGNKLVYIPRGLPDSVKKLHMHSNFIYQIEGLMFSNTSMLEYFDVSNNRIQNISRDAFTGLTKLQTLNFEGNQLEELRAGTFTNLQNLTSLFLGNNPIETIHTGAINNLPNLTTLTLNYNPIEEVTIEEYFLTEMPNLVKLDLMASMGMSNALLNLLGLERDLVMEHVNEVILTYNNLHKLSSIFREVFPNVRKLPIYGNAWICDHELLWLKQWMNSQNSEITFHEYSPAKCETPYGLSGREILDVPDSDFVRHDENLLNDFPYWIVEEEFTKETKDKVKDKNDQKQKDKVKKDQELKLKDNKDHKQEVKEKKRRKNKKHKKKQDQDQNIIMKDENDNKSEEKKENTAKSVETTELTQTEKFMISGLKHRDQDRKDVDTLKEKSQDFRKNNNKQVQDIDSNVLSEPSKKGHNRHRGTNGKLGSRQRGKGTKRERIGKHEKNRNEKRGKDRKQGRGRKQARDRKRERGRKRRNKINIYTETTEGTKKN